MSLTRTLPTRSAEMRSVLGIGSEKGEDTPSVTCGDSSLKEGAKTPPGPIGPPRCGEGRSRL